MVKDVLTVQFSDAIPDTGVCNEWIAPWVERNKNTGSGGMVGPSKGQSNLAFNKLAHDYTWNILDPDSGVSDPEPSAGNVNLHFITKGGSASVPATVRHPLSARLDVSFGGDESGCPLVPFGVFIDSVTTSLIPRPVPENERRNLDGSVRDFVEINISEPEIGIGMAYSSINVTVDYQALSWSATIMNDRLPSSRIAPNNIAAELVGLTLSNGDASNWFPGNGPATLRSTDGGGPYSYPYHVGNWRIINGTDLRLTVNHLSYLHTKYEYIDGSWVYTPDYAAYSEVVFPSMNGLEYSVVFKDRGETILRHTTTQGFIGVKPAPIWEEFPHPDPRKRIFISIYPFGIREVWA